jgi:hypothetical protein
MIQLSPPPIRSTRRDDICNTFDIYMDSLYELAFALGAGEARAEEIYTAALEECLRDETTTGNVDLRLRARDAIIQTAVRIIVPSLSVPDNARFRNMDLPSPADRVRAAISGLRDFDRFVFVMTILEGIPDERCTEVLRRSHFSVAQARARALQAIALAAGAGTASQFDRATVEAISNRHWSRRGSPVMKFQRFGGSRRFCRSTVPGSFVGRLLRMVG